MQPRDVMDTDSPVIQLDTGRTNGSQTKDTETVSLLGERELWDLTTFLIEGVVLPILALCGILGKEYCLTVSVCSAARLIISFLNILLYINKIPSSSYSSS